MADKASQKQPNTLFMTADELRHYADTIDTARASKAFDGMKNADDARKILMERMSKPIEVTDQMRANIVSRVKATAAEGKNELMVVQFPVELCMDDGRAINNNKPVWPDTLTGIPRQAYETWRDRLTPAG